MAICELLGDIFELFRCPESSYQPSRATILTENVARGIRPALRTGEQVRFARMSGMGFI